MSYSKYASKSLGISDTGGFSTGTLPVLIDEASTELHSSANPLVLFLPGQGWVEATQSVFFLKLLFERSLIRSKNFIHKQCFLFGVFRIINFL